jgi:hypothetical protein
MSDSVKKTIEHIRQQIVANIRAGPMPPQEEMPLLSQEYQAVWRAEDEEPGDAELLAILDEPGHQATKPTTPEEHAFEQKTEHLLHQKRWAESEQLAVLPRLEKLLAADERCVQDVLRNNQRLHQQIEACRAEAEQATSPAKARAARHRLLKLQKARRTNRKMLAEHDRTQRKALSAARRNAVEYLGMVKRLEARKEHRKLLRKREQAASGGLGLWGTLGAILAINDFQKMAHGIDKLANKK